MDIPHLPAHCFPNRTREIEGAVIHYFSCVFADPTKAMNPQRCWELMHDINLPKELRKFGPWAALGDKRGYGSADEFITQEGGVIELCTPGTETWHAGNSAHNGKIKLNKHYKGYELIAAPTMDPKYGFKREQYEALAERLVQDMVQYGFGINDIVGHDVARANWNKICVPEQRSPAKPDPSKHFDWPLLFSLIKPPHDLDGG